MATTILMSNDGGSNVVVNQMELESLRGDVVELSGKGLYYKNIHGTYPAYPGDITLSDDSEVIRSVEVFKRFFTKADGTPDNDYIENNIKLANLEELKSKGITYELASKKSRYFYDVLTGEVLNADLMENDEGYRDDVTDKGEYRVLETIIVKDTMTGDLMSPVNGSFRSGSYMYFYGGGDMVLAFRDELSKEITEINGGLTIADVDQILYIQPSSLKAAILTPSGTVEIVELKLR